MKVGHPVQHANCDQNQIKGADVLWQTIYISLDQARFQADRSCKKPRLPKKSA